MSCPIPLKAREDFEWLRQEIVQLKGEASVFLANGLDPREDRDIVQSFQTARGRDVEAFLAETSKLAERLKGLLKGGYVKIESLRRVQKEWKRKQEDWSRLVKIDFFNAPHRAKAEASAADVETLLERAKSISTGDGSPRVPTR
jgi:hypothetical protein